MNKYTYFLNKTSAKGGEEAERIILNVVKKRTCGQPENGFNVVNRASVFANFAFLRHYNADTYSI